MKYRHEKEDGTFLSGSIQCTKEEIERVKKTIVKGERLLSSEGGWLKNGEVFLTGKIRVEVKSE